MHHKRATTLRILYSSFVTHVLPCLYLTSYVTPLMGSTRSIAEAPATIMHTMESPHLNCMYLGHLNVLVNSGQWYCTVEEDQGRVTLTCETC